MEKTIVLALATGQKRFSASLCKLVHLCFRVVLEPWWLLDEICGSFFSHIILACFIFQFYFQNTIILAFLMLLFLCKQWLPVTFVELEKEKWLVGSLINQKSDWWRALPSIVLERLIPELKPKKWHEWNKMVSQNWNVWPHGLCLSQLVWVLTN